MQHACNMLATSVALGWCYGAASALVLRLRRGNIGPRPLECVLAAVDDLTRPDEDPRSGPRPAELVGVKVGDGAPTLHGLGQPAQKDAVAPGCRNAPGARSHPEDKSELGGRAGHLQSQRNHPALVVDLQRPDRVRAESFPVGWVQDQRLSVGGEGAVDFAEEPVGEQLLLPGCGSPGGELLV